MSIFTEVEYTKPKYSTFNLSHQRKMDGQFGKLYPSLVLEVLPGDQFKMNTAQVVRMAPW